MRTFIAIDLPYKIKEEIEAIEKSLQNCGVYASWTKLDNLHLTLKFLGEIDEQQLERVKKVINETACKFISFKAGFENFGFFPNEKNPRVFFIKTTEENQLKKISEDLEALLENLGFERENRFKSHITLARLKSNKNTDCIIKETQHLKIKSSFPIEEIILFKSMLTPSGSIYEATFKAPLLIPPKI